MSLPPLVIWDHAFADNGEILDECFHDIVKGIQKPRRAAASDAQKGWDLLQVLGVQYGSMLKHFGTDD